LTVFTGFQKKIIRNYIIGSVIAVFGVGSIFIFRTLFLTQTEVHFLLLIMLISFSVMFTSEWIVFKKHFAPIHKVFAVKHPSLEIIREAFITLQHFPLLTVKRIMGPHLLGLAVPATIMSIVFIHNSWFHFPYSFVGFAWLGAILIASMHALIEYFLTYRAINPVLIFLIQQSQQRFGKTLELEEKNFLSIKGKLLYSSLFIAIFPVLLFTLASNVQLSQVHGNVLSSYWNWAAAILVVIVFLAAFCSLLLYENIKNPIESLKSGISQIENGHLKPIDNPYSDEFSHLITGFNHMVAGIQERDERNDTLMESFYTVIAATLDARDPYTAGHSIRVAEYAVKIAEEDSMPPHTIDLLRKSSLLHDIGKIGIRDNVLLKEGKLTNEEYTQIKEHPVIGASILEQVNLPDDLKPLLPGVKYHHERYDGKGYPEGLRGENIPLFGRIMAVADAYDAMTSDRPYRTGMPVENALAIIEEGKGTQWDPHFAELFIQIISREKKLSLDKAVLA
jgi:putative nucleotidyltransferase with HDIG domain